MITFDQVSLQYDAKHTALSNINIHIDRRSSRIDCQEVRI